MLRLCTMLSGCMHCSRKKNDDNSVDELDYRGLRSSTVGFRSTRLVMINDDDDDDDGSNDAYRRTHWARGTSEGIDKVRQTA